MSKKLTEKERIFCHEYIIDWNATRSAKEAGYSVKTATEIGYENLRKPHIKEYIDEIKDNLEEEAGLSKLMVLNEHRKLAFSSITHIHNTWIDLIEFNELPDSVKDCISEIQTQVIKRKVPDDSGAYEVVDVEQVKVKLFDKQKSLDSLSKMMGYNQPEKIDHSGSINIPIIQWVGENNEEE